MQRTSTLYERKDSYAEKRKRQFFSLWDREDQLKAFFAWLPNEIHDAPSIDWTRFPGPVMGYCVRIINKSPDATILVIAAAATQGALSDNSLLILLRTLNNLFQSLRMHGKMQNFSDLRNEQFWYDWLTNSKKTSGTRQQVKAYAAVSATHFPSYLLRIKAPERLRMQQYALPPLPPDLTKKHFSPESVRAVQQAKRKSQSDVLVPLYPVLRQLVRCRKQLAERMILAIREARHKVEIGEARLPFHFSYTEIIPEVDRDARTISEAQIMGREVVMEFILWDKPTWVTYHQDRYSAQIIQTAKAGKNGYTPKLNIFFVQFNGPASNLLWFGDLIERRLLQNFKREEHVHSEDYKERWQYARQLGMSNGCACSRPDLLNPADRWLSEVGHRNGDFVFEPEALYRGILFGATLAMIALSNGSRVNELLQVSWNKERRVTRTETVVVLGEDGQPCLDADGKPLTREVKIHLQHLLPKGSQTEEERQLFPLSKEAMRLLGEIKMLLEEIHGEVPIVAPSRSNTKYEHLKSERYLFQWATTSNGQYGSISVSDVQILLRFILHGLDLHTVQGKPIRVSTHLLRHVMATHARQYRHVPPEVIAHFFLHHRLKQLPGYNLSSSEASDYYFMMTEEQRFAIIRADLDEQEELDRVLMRSVPTQRDLEQKNADLQKVYDVWHALHPTALGNCGCPGLCPRENDRSLCLGCSYLVEDSEKLGHALVWRASYAQQSELFEAQGNIIDARQARIKVQQLDDVINVMRMQLLKETEGTYIPLHKILPSPYRDNQETNEKKN